MGTTPIARSTKSESLPDSGLMNSAFDLFKQLVLQSPGWVRIAVVLAMTSMGTLYGLHYFLPGRTPEVSQPYSTAHGQQVSGPGDQQMAEVTRRIKDEDEHSRWHDEHPEDSPPLKKVFQVSDDNYLGYKYYEKTDRCVFVIRKEDGKTSSHWLRDPELRAAALAGRQETHAANPAPPSLDGVGRLFDALVPSAEAATLPGSPLQSHLQPVQTGCVAGTHPGQFTWWWGTPEDQCWVPMYRQWKDGCKHYQRFNKCSNAWDDTIHWVSCSAGPHS